MPSRTKADYLNMFHSQLQSHFRTQKTLARAKRHAHPLNAFGIFLSVNIWGWLYNYLISRVGKKHPFVDYTGSASDGIFEMVSATANDNARIKMVVAADWATDTPESARVGEEMRRENGDYTIHLGDIYFVGAPQEVYCNFNEPHAAWPKGPSGSLAIPGNHEFYSNGNPYFEQLLPHLFARRPADSANPPPDPDYHQTASFFCLENEFWRVIALDNGYYSVGPLLIEYIIKPDAHLDDKLIAWLKNVVKSKDTDKRGILILSHIQYCSAFEQQYPKTAEVLKEIFGEREVIWLWGHEHRLAVYGKYHSEKGITAYGRCIGHGGMPVELGKVCFGRERYTLPDPKKMKGCPLICYDNRKKELLGKTILGHNGYVVLTFDQRRLTIEYKDTSTWLLREHWIVGENGNPVGRLEKNPAVSLTYITTPDSKTISSQTLPT